MNEKLFYTCQKQFLNILKAVELWKQIKYTGCLEKF